MSLQSRLGSLVAAVGADIKALYARSLPSGGAAGQALVKTSSTDYATQWSTISAGGTTYYQALATPQAFTYAGSNVFTLTNPASAIVSVTLNGQSLQPTESVLTTSTTVTVTLESTTFITGDKIVITYVLVGSFTGTSAQDLEFTDPTKGWIERSPDGSRWRVTVSNAGTLITTKL